MKPFRNSLYKTNLPSPWGHGFVYTSALALHCACCIQHATGCVCWACFSLLQRQPFMYETGRRLIMRSCRVPFCLSVSSSVVGQDGTLILHTAPPRSLGLSALQVGAGDPNILRCGRTSVVTSSGQRRGIFFSRLLMLCSSEGHGVMQFSAMLRYMRRSLTFKPRAFWSVFK